MKKIFRFLPALALALTMTACQDNDEENFADKGRIDATSMQAETIVKGTMGDITKTLAIATARPAEKTITATAVVDKSLVATYNKAYYDNAELLPDSCYEVNEATMTINPGSVKSSEASFTFKGLGSLDRSKVFVLPVSVQTSDIEMIASEKNYYYVFKAGALINIVADIVDNYLEIYPWANVSRVQNMTQITMEALVYPRTLDKLISSVMGIEGSFLIRIGDAGIPANQIQLATSSGNVTNSKLQLQTNTWTHIAMTYDRPTSVVKFYLNGKLAYEATSRASIHLAGNGSDRNFLVGKSYDDNRDFDGYISEVRVWDVVRTQEEIAANIYTVDPTSTGLVAYWKFDEGTGANVADASGNGNTLKAQNGPLLWHNVSLPEQ